MNMTQKQCERAVKALQTKGFSASHVMGAPDDHGVWLDGVWNDELQDTHSFRIHEEEIRFWAPTFRGVDLT
tara:strand:+ start:329 stop:541 length:213 start_codon:yes stop_codon:yes gene_type:complete